MVARKKQAIEAQAKAMRYLPICASEPLERKASRPLTTQTLLQISMHSSKENGIGDLRHEGCGKRLKKERNGSGHRREVASQTADKSE